MTFRILLAIFIIFYSFSGLYGQELPPILNFSTEDYKAENQNWNLSQGEEGHIYVANNKGLLEYNGAQWTLYESPNNTIIRSVAAVGERVYTGCYMQFGYWERQETGLLKYTSLSDLLEEPLIEDEHFWNILHLDGWIIFQSLDRIYSFNTKNDSFKIISSQSEITKAFKCNGSIYFQSYGDGLYRIENGEAQLVSDEKVLRENILVDLFFYKGSLLVLTQQNGFFKVDPSGTEKWQTESDSLLETSTIYSSKQLADGSFVLGTISKGIYRLDSSGSLVFKIDQKTGLANNTVLSIFEDRENDVWVGLDNGVSLLDLNSPFMVYRDNTGKLGTVYASAIKNDFLYLGTNQGLFYREREKPESEFELIPGTNGQVWSLDLLGEDLFCGHHLGTFLVKQNRVEQVASIPGTWGVKYLDAADDLLLQGNYTGLYVLEKMENSWRIRNKIKGFDISSRFFAKGTGNNLYISHEYKGVFKIVSDRDFYNAVEVQLLEGVPKSSKAGLGSFGGRLLYGYKEGILSLDKGEERFSIDSVLTRGILLNGEYVTGKLIYDETYERLWGFSREGLVYFSRGKFNSEPDVTRIPFPSATRRDMEGYENITAIDNNTYLIGTSGGYTLLMLDKMVKDPFQINLNSVKNSSRNSDLNYISLKSDSEFSSVNNNFSFSYSVPKYDKYRSVKYQYRLLGIYDTWSDWDSRPEVAFANLPFGDYDFEVRARIGDQISENSATYAFSINRPWYLSLPMIILYFLTFIIIMVLIHFYNRRHYKKQKLKLIEKNERELELSRSEGEKQILKLENEKLEQEVESKSRELAASTMNIVKKNELLKTIKKELDPVNDSGELRSVIRIIDRNLNTKKDWELFEEAFNNADKDFLKKIKERHQKLTPNDLKVCAYLRLNLSSKEIAPLLNISVRSVEIKRYRLRKKMGLEHENSLVEYILSI